jgi:SOS-response transcriptional repressor LexA
MDTAFQSLPRGGSNKTHGMLTPRQLGVLRLIHEFMRRHGKAPTVRELCAATSINSPNGIITHLTALETKGYIETGDKEARSIRLVGARIELVFEDSDEGRRLRNTLEGTADEQRGIQGPGAADAGSPAALFQAPG